MSFTSDGTKTDNIKQFIKKMCTFPFGDRYSATVYYFIVTLEFVVDAESRLTLT